uniref:Uncharacterized protein n=1 Tax=Avena sativa TaxID=4498 RepID=A0ACD5XC83_AVESA
MSKEKLPFVLPAVFTIGPPVTNPEQSDAERAEAKAMLLLYAKLIAPLHSSSSHVHELVKGVIEGEARVMAAELTMEEIFRGTKTFKREVFDKVQKELHQFGLHIYNSNVKQLVDVPGHEYFSYLGQKTQQGAASQARVDVAEARMKGAVGEKEREGRAADGGRGQERALPDREAQQGNSAVRHAGPRLERAVVHDAIFLAEPVPTGVEYAVYSCVVIRDSLLGTISSFFLVLRAY